MLYENLITKQVEEYISYKRSLGYQIIVETGELRRFASYTRSIGHEGSLTSAVAVQWASLKKEYSRFYKARRLETVHTFAKYISAFDADAQIPQLGIFGKSHCRTTPYIYTDEEIFLLMEEAKKLSSPDGLRSLAVSTAIGLLRSTGIRVSELTNLKLDDVNLIDGYLFVRNSKFKKDRLVPLHPTAKKELAGYRDFVEEKLGLNNTSEYFFVSSYGRRFNISSFEYAFTIVRLVLYKEGHFNPNSENRKPRLFDARHTFACETIKRWLKSGEDVNKKLYLLSTYMGHVKPEDTFWYLSATPELLSISCSRYESAFGEELCDNEG